MTNKHDKLFAKAIYTQKVNAEKNISDLRPLYIFSSVYVL